MSMATPRLEIDLEKLHYNTCQLVERLAWKGITVTGVTKVALGNPEIAKTMLRAGVRSIGDSRIENIIRMREAGIIAKFILLRTPAISNVAQVVEYADLSLNTELEVIRELSKAAQEQKKTHQILLMVELGDLREGILPNDLDETVRQSVELPGIYLAGIGTNLACLAGVKPNFEKMNKLSNFALSVEAKFDIKLETVSGGNSANFDWFFNTSDRGRINNLRLGESIFLGVETLYRTPIEGLHTDAIVLVAEVIESNLKSSVPLGELCQNAFGEKRIFQDRGSMNHTILGIGRQDILLPGITPARKEIDIFGASSDHVIVISNAKRLQIGEEVEFHLNYGALLAAMTSPYVEKVYLNRPNSSGH